MSYFSSLMSSLGDQGSAPNPPKATTTSARPAISSTSQTTNKPQSPVVPKPNTSVPQTSLKRKADDSSRTTPPKKASTSSSASATKATTKGPTLTSRLSQTSISNPSLKPDATTRPTSASITKPPPKKGSYREIMARAAAQQPSSIGQIKHKAVVKLSRKERIKAAQEQAQQRKHPGTEKGRGTDSETKDKASTKESTKKEPVYQGTARPRTEPIYKGTARSGLTSESSRNPKLSSKKSSSKQVSSGGGRYTYYSSPSGSEEEEDYDNEDESDDMEGGGFDELEAEEEASLRAAQKEDMEALRQEQEHRSKKMAQKAALAELQRRRAQRA